MSAAEDAPLLDVIRQAIAQGTLRLHVSYRRARRVRRFHQLLVQKVGARAVAIRDWFMAGALTLLIFWFVLAQLLELEGYSIRILGTEVKAGVFSFLLVLLALVLFARRYIRPLQGQPLREVALTDEQVFDELWRAGALALLATLGDDRLCQSPRDDWRQFARRLSLQG